MRDQTFHRTQRLQVRTIKQALDFVNRAGFCFAFSAKNPHLPCLWHAACGERNPHYPVHTHSDPYIGLVWEAKDILPFEKKIYYGKAIKKTPTMISLEYFPCFYRLARPHPDDQDYLSDFMRGELSSSARRIMDALTDHSPQITSDLKLSSGFAHPDKRPEFDHAMAELQMKMYVVKIAEFYEPFTFLWDLVDRRFSEVLTGVKSMTLHQARKKILGKYFTIVFAADDATLRTLFGWQSNDIQQVLTELVDEDILCNDVLQDLNKKIFVLKKL